MRGLRRFASRGTGTIGFTMVTRVRGDRIQLIHQWRVVFDADLLKQPFTTVYRSVLSKQGNVGFRCFPDEEATITRVVVREPAVTPNKRLQPTKARAGRAESAALERFAAEA